MSGLFRPHPVRIVTFMFAASMHRGEAVSMSKPINLGNSSTLTLSLNRGYLYLTPCAAGPITYLISFLLLRFLLSLGKQFELVLSFMLSLHQVYSVLSARVRPL